MPMQPRSRTGILSRPLLMYCILAIWLTISPTRVEDEVDEHEIDHRPRAGHRRAAGQADEAALADRRVAQPLGAVHVEQPGRRA